MRGRLFRTVLVLLGFSAGVLAGGWAARAVHSAIAPAPPPGPAVPVAVVPVDQRDLGPVAAGEVLRTAFPIRNAGGRRLVVWEAKAACCGKPGEPRQTIVEAGRSAELWIEIDTSRWDGELCEVVRYRTNDPKQPQLALTVKATVKPPDEAVSD